MDNRLFQARQLAETVRFAGDLPSAEEAQNSGQIALIRRVSYENAIEISPVLTPGLHKSFSKACERLRIPPDLVTSFIYSSRDIQGECYADEQRCVVRFSTGLVDLLDEEEFEFVVGHEIGHFLLAHHSRGAKERSGRFEYFRQRRSQEISCDRIGVLSCSSLDIALRALMKTMSGLTSRHLRFDVRAFIGQLRKLEGSGTQGFEVTHPSALLRAKAILWFSLSDTKALASNSRTILQELKLIDERVERDLTKFVDGAVRERISRLKEDLLLWMIGVEIVQFGSFSADIQSRMHGLFDQETIEKLKSFLGSLTKSSAETEVYQKMLAARGELETIVPDEIVETVSTLGEQASRIVQVDRVKE